MPLQIYTFEQCILMMVSMPMLVNAYDPNTDICLSLEGLSNRTSVSISKYVESSCTVPKVCTGIDCYISVRDEIPALSLRYGLSFENLCYKNSTFLFYWGVHNISKRFFEFDAVHSINISSLTSSSSIKRDSEIIIETQIIIIATNYFTVTIQVTLKFSETKLFPLFPAHSISFPICDQTQIPDFDEDTSQESVTIATITRVETDRECMPGYMGDCRDNEVCRESNATATSFKCFCFDEYQLNSEDACETIPSNSFNYNTLWGIIGGLSITMVIVVTFTLLIWKFYRKTRRYNDFDLIPQDVSSLDPPMLEA